jgi:ribose 1,5-bisphosphokinase
MDAAIKPALATRGRLIVIVGPSGAGKDTLIDYARRALADRPDFGVVQRVITRPEEAGGEAHSACDLDDFARMKAEGAFCVDWGAHGLCYGVPAELRQHIASGALRLVNGSRRALPLFRKAFADVETVLVTAAPEVLARRLAARGRESLEEIKARLARQVEDRPEDYDLVISNDGAVDVAGERLAAFLRGE